jgi:hypothetical protein
VSFGLFELFNDQIQFIVKTSSDKEIKNMIVILPCLNVIAEIKVEN